MSFFRRYTEIWLLLALAAVTLASRLVLLYLTEFRVDADEAIVGLMAKHISEGLPWPVFYYGQPYMGSLESILVAPLFYFFGVSSVLLKIVPLVFAVLHVALAYILARQFVPRAWAFGGALSVAFAPSALVEWSAKARGGFIELVFLGSLSLILAVIIARKAVAGNIAERSVIVLTGFLGFVLGAAWWVNNQAIFYILSIGLYLALVFLCYVRFKVSVLSVLVGGGSFIVGSLPFWIYNLFETPHFATFKLLGGHAKKVEAIKHFEGFFSEALPILLGSRRFWTDQDILPGLSLVVWAYACLVFLCALWLVVQAGLVEADVFRGKIRSSKGLPGRNSSGCSGLVRSGLGLPESRGLGLLLIFVCLTAIVFSVSTFGWLTKAPRYLLPLYSVYPVFVALLGYSLWSSRFLVLRVLGLCSILLPLGLSYLSNYWGAIAIPGEPFIYQSERVAKDQQRLYRWLGENNYAHIRTNYWIGYRAAFETAERVTFTRFKEPLTLRIPRYEEANRDILEHVPYVLTPLQARDFSRGLSHLGYGYEVRRIGDYVVIDHVARRDPVGEPVQVSPQWLSSSHGRERLPSLVDKSLGTRWGSGAPQAPGMEVRVRFPQPQSIGAVRVSFGFWKQDYPRHLVIEVEDEKGKFCELFSSAGNYALDSFSNEWEISFPRITARSLVLRQEGRDPVFDWSIAELGIYNGAIYDEVIYNGVSPPKL